MGMSATQARYLSLVAQQSNLEYQGQQINQERAILSQQVSELYNSLLAINVPTPPSTQDYTSVEYVGNSGATTYKFDASDVKPGKDGGYIVSLGYTDYGHSLTKKSGYATTSQGYEDVKGTLINPADTKPSTQTQTVTGHVPDAEQPTEAPANGFFKTVSEPPADGEYYVYDESGTAFVMGGQGYVDNEQGPYFVFTTDASQWDTTNCFASSTTADIEVTTDVPAKTTVSQDDLENLYKVDNEGIITKAEAGIDYTVDDNGNVSLIGDANFFVTGNGSDSAKKGSGTGYKIGGHTAMTMEEYKASFNEKNIDVYNGYCEAIANSGLKDSTGEPYGPEHFMVAIDDDGQPHFALASDVKDNGTCVTYDYIANGQYTKKDTYDNAKLTFDPSSGRITNVDIPTTDPETGEVTGWTSINLEAKTVTDEMAYNDAFAQYEFEQYEYDRKQQEINAKTKKIQEQDRTLELRLQRLDTQRTQITTEMEALEKVLNDNIESSYKTFSG